ncbi:MAG: M15 family metallopeptidase [Clostridiaceae bacterium]|nr:M15 family metallopeptidase [Clostridiaceae bacterium]
MTSIEVKNDSKDKDGDTTENFLILVNREHELSKDYMPKNLVEVNISFSPGTASQQRMMQKTAAKALETLFAQAENDGIILYGVSGYRSYDYQKKIYDRKVNAVGRTEADKYVACPGQSEHHTGLAMDVINEEGVSKLLTASFGETKEGQWLNDNAHEFGFIIRYPEGKEDITGYNYEPWHLRYVGKEAAREIMSRGLVLEEYLEEYTD